MPIYTILIKNKTNEDSPISFEWKGLPEGITKIRVKSIRLEDLRIPTGINVNYLDEGSWKRLMVWNKSLVKSIVDDIDAETTKVLYPTESKYFHYPIDQDDTYGTNLFTTIPYSCEMRKNELCLLGDRKLSFSEKELNAAKLFDPEKIIGDDKIPKIEKLLIQITGVNIVGAEGSGGADITEDSVVYQSEYPIPGVIAESEPGVGTWYFNTDLYEFVGQPVTNFTISVQLLGYSENVLPALMSPGETVKIVVEVE